MAIYLDSNENEIEIPTLEVKCDYPKDIYVKVTNIEDAKLLIKCMGFNTVHAFEEEAKYSLEMLLGLFWHMSLDGSITLEESETKLKH